MRLIPERLIERAVARWSSVEFESARNGLRQRTRALIAVDLNPPDEPAGTYHDYFCPKHATELRFDPGSPFQHICPIDGQVWTGSPFDEAWRFGAGYLLAHGSFRSALLWRMDGDIRAKERATSILIGYANRYTNYPLGSYSSRGGRGHGRATYQSLDESNIIIPMARAYDLLRDSMSPANRARIECDLLRPAAEHILHERFLEIHNIECWHHAAIAAVGMAIGDDAYVEEAIAGPYGFWRQLREGLSDGLWWECSSSYHFYAAHALTTLAAVVASARPECAQSTELHKMYSAPLTIRMSDGRLPATNDCWFFSSLYGEVCHGVPAARELYEVAAGWYGDGAFHRLLSENHRLAPRDSMEALLYGPDVVTEGKNEDSTDVGSVSLPTIGLTILRNRSAEPSAVSEVLLKHGPSGGGHGHPDKLALSLYTAGEPVSPDLGSPGYRVPLHRSWYQQSFSHNTVILDRKSQPPAEAKLDSFQCQPDKPDQVRAQVHFDDKVDEIYTDTVMRRAVVCSGRYFLDLFSVSAPAEHVLQWLFRVRGAFAQITGAKGTGVEVGLPHVGVREEGVVGHSAVARWRIGTGWLAMHFPAEDGGSLAICEAPYMPASECTDLVVRSRIGRSSNFLTVLEIGSSDEGISKVEFEASTATININHDGCAQRWRLPNAKWDTGWQIV